MGQYVEDSGQVLPHALLAAGKVHDERAGPYDGNRAAEHGALGHPESGGAHGFGDTGYQSFGHVQRSFGSNVAPREAGSPRGQNEVKRARVGPHSELRGDALAFVGDDSVLSDFPTNPHNEFTNGGTAGVVALATTAFVADR